MISIKNCLFAVICIVLTSVGAHAQVTLTGAGRATPGGGATFYVDTTVPDTNPGSSTPDCTNYNPATFTCSGGSASVYATIADLNVTSFAAGASVLFRRGQTWREMLVPITSGTAGNPITFGAFGTGAQPAITGTNLLSSGWVNQVEVAAQTGNSFTFINLGNAAGQVRQASQWVATSSFSVTAVRLWLNQQGTITTGNLTVSIYNDSAGAPNAIIANGTSATITANTITKNAAGQEYTFTFATPPALTSGSTYYFSLEETFTTSGTNFIKAYGSAVTGSWPKRFTFTPWSAHTDDVMYIKVFKTGGSVWEQDLTTQVSYLMNNGSIGNPVATVAALATQGDWVWTGNSLYEFSVSAPSTFYSTPGVEAGQRNYAINPTQSYITIDNLHLYGANGLANILFGSNSGASDIVQNCEIDHSPLTGVYIWGVDHGTVQNNYVHDIWNGATYTTTGSGNGVTVFDANAVGNQIRYNLVRNNFRGVFIYGNGGTQNPTFTSVFANLVENSLVNGIDQFQTNAAAGPTTVYNNTVIHNPMAGAGWGSGHGIDIQDTGADGIDIENNIIYSSYSGTNVNVELVSLSSSVALTTVTIDFNDYFLAGGSTANLGQDNSGTRYNTLAAWRTFLNGTAFGGKDANSISTDPVFTNFGTLDLTLQGTSPAINAGAVLGSFFQNDLKSGSTWPGGVLLGNQSAAVGPLWVIGAYVFP